MMYQGVLKHNQSGRYEIPGTYFTSGDQIELLIEGKWVAGRIEYCYKNDDYYFLSNEIGNVYQLTGYRARVGY